MDKIIRIPASAATAARALVCFSIGASAAVAVPQGGGGDGGESFRSRALEWGGVFGGSGDEAPLQELAMHVDARGRVWLAGGTSSPDLPVTANAWQPALAGEFDAWFACVSPRGELLYASYLGGLGQEFAHGIAVDPASGRVWLTGRVLSTGFPTTNDALFRNLQGGWDAFVSVFDLDAAQVADQLVFSSYLGGDGADVAVGIALDASGRAWLGGKTDSRNWPVTAGAFASSFAGVLDGFVTAIELPAAGAPQLFWSSYFGGGKGDQLSAIAWVAAGPLAGSIVCGGSTNSLDFPVTANAPQPALAAGMFHEDAWIAVLDPALGGAAALRFGSYLGGGPGRARGAESAAAVAAVPDGTLYLYGTTDSDAFPTTPKVLQSERAGGRDLFLARFDPLAGDGWGSEGFATLLGGNAGEEAHAMVLEADAAAVLAGATASPDLPLPFGAAQSRHAGGTDAVLMRVAPNGDQVLQGALLGSAGEDRALALGRAPGGDLFLSGTAERGFPQRNGRLPQTEGGRDLFLARLRLGPQLALEGGARPGARARFTLHQAPSALAGSTALVLASARGPGLGPQLRQGLHLPILPDALTQWSLRHARLFTATVLADGTAATPWFPWPGLPPGAEVWFTAALRDVGRGRWLAVAAPLRSRQ